MTDLRNDLDTANVWVVEQGSYSDYRVVGVFTSRANAQKIVDKLKASDTYEEPTIAKWPLNPAVEELNAGLNQWRIAFSKVTRNAERPVLLAVAEAAKKAARK